MSKRANREKSEPGDSQPTSVGEKLKVIIPLDSQSEDFWNIPNFRCSFFVVAKSKTYQKIMH